MNEGKIVISPSKKVREGWAELIKMEMDKIRLKTKMASLPINDIENLKIY